MINQNGQYDLLDMLTIVSFFIGVANYEENVDQSTMDETVKKAVEDIHRHLKTQDQKIEKILDILEVQNDR